MPSPFDPAPFLILGPGDLGQSGQADESASADAILTCADIYLTVAESWLA
jgi:succinyl-diaminopimelate desuccinylase